jgi:hypothetical protein
VQGVDIITKIGYDKNIAVKTMCWSGEGGNKDLDFDSSNSDLNIISQALVRKNVGLF